MYVAVYIKKNNIIYTEYRVQRGYLRSVYTVYTWCTVYYVYHTCTVVFIRITIREEKKDLFFLSSHFTCGRTQVPGYICLTSNILLYIILKYIQV